MDRINTTIFVVSLVFLFVYFTFFVFVFSSHKKVHLKRKSVYQIISLRELMITFAAAFGITLFLSDISFSNITSSCIFTIVIALAPYVILNNSKRIYDEKLFSEVIMYCQNMGLVLRQTHLVYESLSKVENDISIKELKDDINKLKESFKNGYDSTQEVMNEINSKYQYECVRSLNLFMIHMFYENSNISNELLGSYEDDVTELDKSVKRNQAKRKTLRIQYIGINIGCFIVYGMFVGSIRDAFGQTFEGISFSIVNTIFILLMLISLFIVDRYFNRNITKE